MIGAGRHTKAKRQVPGRVSLRLRICLSLGKLINPLGFEPCRASSFYLLVKWQAGFHLSLSLSFFFPFPLIYPRGKQQCPFPSPCHQPVCLFAFSLDKLKFSATDKGKQL